MTEGAAYGLGEIVSLLLLGAARPHLPPKEMAGAWGELQGTGRLPVIVTAARELGPSGRFDLVVAPEHALLRVALDDEELLEAVRHPSVPIPVVVVDLAPRVRMVVGAFSRIANRTRPPAARSPGRPRSGERGKVVSLSAKGGR